MTTTTSPRKTATSRAAEFQVEVFHGERLQHSFALAGRVVLGRQLNPREGQWQLAHHEASGDERMAIAPFSDVRVSRRQLSLLPVPTGVEVENTSTNPVLIDHRSELAPGARRVLAAPCRLAFGPDASYVVSIWAGESSAMEMHTLPHQAPAPSADDSDEAITALEPLALSDHDTNAVRIWLKAITEVLRSATGQNDFLQRAVRRVVGLMRFDAARVLVLRDGQWTCQAEVCRKPDRSTAATMASQRILRRMCDERRTIWQDAAERPAGDHSQAGVSAIIASPIRNRGGDVIGALYADRWSGGGRSEVQISSAEAMLVETLAFGIAAGLERTRQDEELVEQRVRFNQFFGQALGEQLAANESLLDSKDAEVTVLVVDIRGFSGISERVGTERSLAWIRDTLDVLTNIVMDHAGVVVDYVGDEMMAMWGAPVPQPDQAPRRSGGVGNARGPGPA